MKYAQIKDGRVRNIIILNDLSVYDLLLQGFDYLIRVDNLDIQPSLMWTYDGSNFYPFVDDE